MEYGIWNIESSLAWGMKGISQGAGEPLTFWGDTRATSIPRVWLICSVKAINQPTAAGLGVSEFQAGFPPGLLPVTVLCSATSPR